MPRAPYINFPFPFYKNYSRVPPYYPPPTTPEVCQTNKNSDSLNNNSQKNKSNKNDNYLFDLLGLKIYYDDVLLVSLLYCLYSEGVKDDGLFIVLILLLLS